VTHQPLRSLRGWLQSTAVLTVIAGYSLLLGLNSVLSDLQRRELHRDLIQTLVAQASAGQAVPEALNGVWLEVSLLSQGTSTEPRIQLAPSGEQWLVSRRAVQLPSGEEGWLELRQNVTGSLEQERTTQLLLVAAAGVSILFTSLLLRPVLRRGLVVPLDQLDQELQRLEADNLGEHLFDPASQPEELRAIAIAFNCQRKSPPWGGL